VSVRPPVPEEVKRRVLVEAGHRCAIPTCRNPDAEIAHIVPYRKVQEHKYENLIALCPNCHARADRGEIDRKALRMYKRILQRLTDRYDRFELNVLDELRQGHPVMISGSMVLLIKNILDDNLVQLPFGFSWGMVIYTYGRDNTVNVSLTKKGEEFISEWLSANESMTY
jgi:hypothetical protein